MILNDRIPFFIFLCSQENETKEAARVTGYPLRFSPSAGPVELAALKQPQALVAAVCDAQARDEGAKGIAFCSIGFLFLAFLASLRENQLLNPVFPRGIPGDSDHESHHAVTQPTRQTLSDGLGSPIFLTYSLCPCLDGLFQAEL